MSLIPETMKQAQERYCQRLGLESLGQIQSVRPVQLAKLEKILGRMTLASHGPFDLLYLQGRGEVVRAGHQYSETSRFGALRVRNLPNSTTPGLSFFYFDGTNHYSGSEIIWTFPEEHKGHLPVTVSFNENPDPTKEEDNQVILVPKMRGTSDGLALRLTLGAKLDVSGIRLMPEKSMAQQYKEQGVRYKLPTITRYVLLK